LASKQHVFDTAVVLWHEVVPLVLQLEDIRLSNGERRGVIASVDEPMRGPARADVASAAMRAMVAAMSADREGEGFPTGDAGQ
jgi:hypothetical protein